MPNKYYAFDARLDHRSFGSAALTATATLATITSHSAQRTAFLTKLTIEAIDVASGNESYILSIECSNDGFATFDVAATLELGHSSVRRSTMSNAAGDSFDVLWATEINDVKYAAARIRLIVAGTSPSITASCHSTVGSM